MLTTSAAIALFLLALEDSASLDRLVAQGKYTEAETVLKDQLQTTLAPADRARTLLNLIEIYRQSGRPSLAAPFVDESVRLAMQTDDHALRARAFQSSATGLQLHGRTQEAEQQFRSALTLAPAASIERAEILNSYARLLMQNARLTEAETHLKAAIRLLEDPSTDPLRLAVVLHTYAILRFHQSRYKESTLMLQRAEASLSAADADVPLRGEILGLQGLIAKAQGALPDAARLLRASIAFFQRQPERYCGLEAAAEPFLNFAALLLEQRQFREGLAAVIEADLWILNSPEPRHFQQAEAKGLLGWAYQGLHHWSGARNFYTQALAFYRQTANPESERTGIILVNLAGVAWHQRAYPESAQLLEEARPILDREGVPNSSRVARLLLAAKVARKLGNKTQAASLQQQAKALTTAEEEDLRQRHTVSVQALRQQQ